MGQKVHPIGLRLGIIETWSSKWFSSKQYAQFLHEDLWIRRHIKDFSNRNLAAISKTEIERAASKVTVHIHTARPGIVIGKKGSEVERLRREIEQKTHKEVFLNIIEIRKAELDAQLVAENIAHQLERRVAFRRAMRKAVTTSLKFGAQGIKVCCAGRLGGAEMARTEWYREGRVPLHTLRASIDYGFTEARTTYGAIGVKVWIFKGEILPSEDRKRKEVVGA